MQCQSEHCNTPRVKPGMGFDSEKFVSSSKLPAPLRMLLLTRTDEEETRDLLGYLLGTLTGRHRRSCAYPSSSRFKNRALGFKLLRTSSTGARELSAGRRLRSHWQAAANCRTSAHMRPEMKRPVAPLGLPRQFPAVAIAGDLGKALSRGRAGASEGLPPAPKVDHELKPPPAHTSAPPGQWPHWQGLWLIVP